MKIRKALSRERHSKKFTQPSKAVQSSRDECDINVIMARYRHTGMIDHVETYRGDYGDFTAVQDFETSMNQIKAAEAMFMSLPADVRKAFDNEPSKFIEAVATADDETLQEMGLMPAADRPAPVVADPEPEPSDTPSDSSEDS